MKINSVVIAILVVAILAFLYFIIKRNKKDQKALENELNQKEIMPHQHTDEHL
jgi:preprotein translocase subunit YajC